jgi:hypothetical protein
MGNVRGEPRGRQGIGERQGIAQVPAVDADVLVPLVQLRRRAAVAPFPVVLVRVGELLQSDRQHRPFQQANGVAEPILQPAQQALDVERQATEGPAVRWDDEWRVQRRGHLCGPRKARGEDRPAGHSLSQGVADGHQQMPGRVGHRRHLQAGHSERDAEGRVGDSRRNLVGDDDLGRRLTVEVLGR